MSSGKISKRDQKAIEISAKTLNELLYGVQNHSTSVTEVTDEPQRAMSQADRILAKFGGPTRLAYILRSIGIHSRGQSTIARWRYPKSKGGTGGRIPNQAWPLVFAAARAEGIVITAEDLDPRELAMDAKQQRAFPAKIRRKRGMPVF